ncbi:MAG: DegT/DnrJ/EryC1/StrS family aminotransferase [Chryseolinea sp.]
MILVTKPFLPPQHEYQRYLDGIWGRQWLTNNGPLVNELELRLKNYLNVPHLLYLSNGTIALQIAIKALGLKGEIITTPFSYVATTSSIVWEGCKPVFVDIDGGSLNIDPTKIEAAITDQTSAILATHVFGNPCDIESIEAIANRNNIPVIYDAAHCFGTLYKNQSVFNFGKICTTSFHATKLFHTVEGGAVFTQDDELLKKMALLKNFGHNGPVDFADVGINGKNSEFHAAMGLANLKYIEAILKSRKDQSLRYDQWLDRVHAQRLVINKDAEFNYSYYPLILKDEATTLKVIQALESNRISPRRYFYPSLNTTAPYKSGEILLSESVSKRIICLPLYYSLSEEEIDFISRIILRAITY